MNRNKLIIAALALFSGVSALFAAPAAITNLVVSSDLQIKLQWTAPNNGSGGAAASYLVKYSTSGPLETEAGFSSASSFTQNWAPMSPGGSETRVLTSLKPGTTYWFSIKSYYGGAWSTMTVAAASCGFAGSYIDANITLAGVYNSAVAWGDYDNDGDLDCAVAGANMSNLQARIYRNNGGVFSDIGAALSGVSEGDVVWGDIDNDGDLDLALTGSNLTKLYRNNKGVFSEINAGLPGIKYSSIALGDYDNDGDLDIALNGGDWGSSISRIYRNDSCVFTDIQAGLIGRHYGEMLWMDIDNDGDLDLVSAGAGSGSWVKVYRNDKGIFTDTLNAIEVSLWVSLAGADYDNDGDLDLAVSGHGTGGSVTRIYRNDGGVFNVMPDGLLGVSIARDALAWGDYDNDGDFDLAAIGQNYIGAPGILKIFRNDNGTYTDTRMGLPGYQSSSLALGDYDNDGDLDMLVSGGTYTSGTTRILKSVESENGNLNTAPAAPSGGFSESYVFDPGREFKNQITMKWSAAADGDTFENAMEYEVRISTWPIHNGLNNWIVSPSSGAGMTPFRGNYSHGFISSNLQPGLILKPVVYNATYYWQVRSVDSGYRRSEWSAQRHCYVPALPAGCLPPGITDLKAESEYQIKLSWKAPHNGYGGRCGSYELKYTTTGPIDSEAKYSAAKTYQQSWEPAGFSSNEQKTITSLRPNTTYWFSLKASSGTLWSTLSSAQSSFAVSGFLVNSGVVLPSAYNSTVIWGDYDNDGDLDLAMAGYASGYMCKIFRNDNGILNDIGADIPGIEYPSLAWGDYDNDGDLDLALSGQSYSIGNITRIYRNDKGVFNDAGAGLPGTSNGAMVWCDYNNDGELDLLFTGGGSVRLYKNTKGSFSAVKTNFKPFTSNSVDMGDYDNDGDLDLVITGSIDYLYTTTIYRNDSGTFVDSGLNIEYCGNGAAAWGDYDNDGDLDLGMSGYNSGNYRTYIYRNDAGVFVKTATGLPAGSSAKFAWVDFDSDGRLDIALIAQSNISKIFFNDAGVFTLRSAPIPYAYMMSMAWGDYDNDNDQDLAISGYTGSGYLSGIFKSVSSEFGNTNAAPSAPAAGFTSNYYTSVSGVDTIKMKWNPGSDSATPAQGMHYAVRAATAPITDSLNKWYVSFSSGAGTSPSRGNIPHGFIESGTQPGMLIQWPLFGATYYWQVSSIDTSGKRSAWSPTQLIYVPKPPANQAARRIEDLAVSSDLQIKLTWTAPHNNYGGRCGAYQVRYSTQSAIDTEAKYNAAAVFPQNWIPAEPREIEEKILTGLMPDTTYWFSVKASSSALWSAISATQTCKAVAGSFYDSGIQIEGGNGGDAAWVDYDNDGDIDLFITGYNSTYGNMTKLYRNNGGVFAQVITGAEDIRSRSFDWSDYDNDGDLDFIVSGSSNYYNYSTRIFRNDRSGFAAVDTGITGYSNLALDLGDYNGDGFADLVITGKEQDLNEGHSAVYKYENGAFTNAQSPVAAMHYGSVSWADYDSDGDLDLALFGGYGTYSTTKIGKIYRNDDGYLTDVNANIPGVNMSSLAWGDYDNDGDLDMALSGMSYYSKLTAVYRNDNGVLNQLGVSFPGADYSKVAWGDYDNDGDLDLLISGRETSSSEGSTRVYINRNGTFTSGSVGFIPALYTAAAWGDYDNDGDLDIFLSGQVGSITSAKIYRNINSEFGRNNASPVAPAGGFGSAYKYAEGEEYVNELRLTWSAGSDLLTPANGLQYNIRVATAPIVNGMNKWVVSPSSGSGATPFMGNYPKMRVAASQPGIVIRPPSLNTTYYWQVQAIDSGFKASGWSSQQSKYVPPAAPDTIPSRITSLSLSSDAQLRLSWTAPHNGYGGKCGGYKVKYSTTGSINTYAEFNAAATWYHNWLPLSPGSTEAYVLTGLIPNTTYWFSIRSSTNTLWSSLSSTATSSGIPGIFAKYAVAIASVTQSSVAWGDYDNDGDLDLAIAGWVASGNYITKIYRNNQGNFVDIGAGLPGVYDCSLAWADYDNDGDLDLALTGYNGSSRVGALYRNDKGQFNDTGTAITPVRYPSVAWGDYDNDGDLDLVAAGEGVSGVKTQLYRNDSSSITAAACSFANVYNCTVAWGDYDNDGDLDLAVAGHTASSSYASKIYRNDNGVFTDIAAPLTAVGYAALAWGDYDNDGDLDISVSGLASVTRYTKVYRNTNGVFADIISSVTALSTSYGNSMEWGDCDNDGDLDLVYMGYNGSTGVTKFYINDDGVFRDKSGGLRGAYYGSITLADFDNDKDTDLFVTGFTGTQVFSECYKSLLSEQGKPNTPPLTPSGLSEAYSLEDNFKAQLRLSWNRSSDGQTPEKGLYYNVRVATKPITAAVDRWIMSPSTGAGCAPFTGNYPHGYAVASSTQPGLVFFAPLFDTTYYWQVQAIDAAFARSAWSGTNAVYVPQRPAFMPVPAPSGFSAKPGLQVKLEWKTPSNGYGGKCDSYMLKYSAAPIEDEADFAAAATWEQDWAPLAPGTTVGYSITGLAPNTTYWFSIKASSNTVWSVMSSTSGNKAVSGSFMKTGFEMLGTYGSANIEWGDYDCDNDLDILLCGYDASITGKTYIYRNDVTTFTSINSGLAKAYGSVHFVNYDDLPALDVSVCGSSGSVTISSIYRKNYAGYSLLNLTEPMLGLTAGYSDWGDYDNDGDPDIMISGAYSGGRVTILYRNDMGAFEKVWELGNIAGCTEWGDYDNDGDMDFAVMGYNGMGGVFELYRNEGGSFIKVQTNITPCHLGDLEWVDYDNDGDLDLSISGNSYGVEGYITKLYANEDGVFTDVNAGMRGVNYSALAWGDYDNDGDPDMILAGSATGYILNPVIYRNEGTGFTEIETGIYQAYRGGFAWGDYDKDGDLDLAITGYDPTATYKYQCSIIKNLTAENGKVNQAPSAPSDATVSAVYDPAENIIALSWESGSDTETPVKGLNYEIRAAALPIEDGMPLWLISPSSGAGVSNYESNCPHGFTDGAAKPSVRIHPKSEGTTFYYQVRTIDSSLAKSSWTEQKYLYMPMVPPGAVNTLSVEPVAYAFVLKWTAPGSNGQTLNLGSSGSYIIKYSLSEINTEAEFNAAEAFTQNMLPQGVGRTEQCIVTGLQGGVRYYFSVKARDAKGNYSALGNTVSGVCVDMNVNSITPSVGTNDGTVECMLRGSGFTQGIWAKLIREGQQDIQASGVDVISSSQALARFNLSEKVTGRWDVAVTKGMQSARNYGTFRIIKGQREDINWVWDEKTFYAVGSTNYRYTPYDEDMDGKDSLYQTYVPSMLTYRMRYSTGAWTRTSLASQSPIPMCTAKGDADNDGRLDFLLGATGSVSGGVYIFKGLDGFTPQKVRISTCSVQEFNSIYVADVNGDGRNEVIHGNTTAPGSATPSELYCTYTANGRDWATSLISPNPYKQQWGAYAVFAVGDADNDGRSEVYVLDADTQIVRCSMGPDGWKAEPLSIQMNETYFMSLLVGDCNNDKKNELYAVCGNMDINIAKIEYEGNDWSMALISTHAANVFDKPTILIGDADNDGRDELYSVADNAYGENAQGIYRVEYRDGSWASDLILASTRTITNISIGDATGDGYQKLYYQHTIGVTSSMAFQLRMIPEPDYGFYDQYNILSDGGSPGSLGVYYGGTGNIALSDDYLNFNEGVYSTKCRISCPLSSWTGAFVDVTKVNLHEKYFENGALKFSIMFSTVPPPNLIIGIRSMNVAAGSEKTKLKLKNYITSYSSYTWYDVMIPLKDFQEMDTAHDFTQMAVVFNLAYTAADCGGAWSGDIWLDGVKWLTPERLDRISVFPEGVRVGAGGSKNFTVTAYNSENQSLYCSTQPAWAVSNASVGTITPSTGTITTFTASGSAVNGDNAIISCSVGGKSDYSVVNISTKTYTITYHVYDDSGIPSSSDISVWEADSAYEIGEITGDGGALEGEKYMRQTVNSAWGGWGVVYMSSVENGVRDLTLYGAGDLRFWVKTPVDLKVEMQDTGPSGVKKAVRISNYSWDGTNTWQEIIVPMADFAGSNGIDITKVHAPFLVSAEAACVFHIDNVTIVAESQIRAPKDVRVSGGRLYLDGSEFIVRGVNGSFIPPGQSADYDWSTNEANYRNDINLLKAMNANTVRITEQPSNLDALAAFEEKGIYFIMTYKVSAAEAAGNPAGVKAGFLAMVDKYMASPYVLAWCLGDGTDSGLTGSSLASWYQLVEECAQAAHEKETIAGIRYHPVTTANSDLGYIGDPSFSADDASMQHLDFWSVNSFRGQGFGTLFADFSAKSGKPLLVSRFGCDAYDGRTGYLKEDQAIQKTYVSAQWSQIALNLNTEASPSGKAIGGVVHQWRDAWYASSANTLGNNGHDTSSDRTNTLYLDQNINDEWWGICAVSSSQPSERYVRQVYQELADVWKGAQSVKISVLRRADNIPAEQLGWAPPALPAAWKASSEYLKVECDTGCDTWGMQIYTDNCASNADPQFFIVNPTSYNPAGLINSQYRDQTLKLCWRVTDEPLGNAGELVISEKADGQSLKLYDPGLGDGYACYLWMKDKSTPAIQAENTLKFENGEDYATVWDSSRGFQHAEGTWAQSSNPVKYIYLGANFRNALTPNTYRTNKLTLEFFVE